MTGAPSFYIYKHHGFYAFSISLSSLILHHALFAIKGTAKIHTNHLKEIYYHAVDDAS